MSEKEGLQHGTETCCDVWFVDGGKKSGGRAEGGRVKNVKVFTGSDQNGENLK